MRPKAGAKPSHIKRRPFAASYRFMRSHRREISYPMFGRASEGYAQRHNHPCDDKANCAPTRRTTTIGDNMEHNMYGYTPPRHTHSSPPTCSHPQKVLPTFRRVSSHDFATVLLTCPIPPKAVGGHRVPIPRHASTYMTIVGLATHARKPTQTHLPSTCARHDAVPPGLACIRKTYKPH